MLHSQLPYYQHLPALAHMIPHGTFPPQPGLSVPFPASIQSVPKSPFLLGLSQDIGLKRERKHSFGDSPLSSTSDRESVSPNVEASPLKRPKHDRAITPEPTLKPQKIFAPIPKIPTYTPSTLSAFRTEDKKAPFAMFGNNWSNMIPKTSPLVSPRDSILKSATDQPLDLTSKPLKHKTEDKKETENIELKKCKKSEKDESFGHHFHSIFDRKPYFEGAKEKSEGKRLPGELCFPFRSFQDISYQRYPIFGSAHTQFNPFYQHMIRS